MAGSTQTDIALLLMRVSGLSLFWLHGWGKLTRLASGEGERFIAGVAALGFPAPAVFAWAAALAEVAGGLCVALGLATRISGGLAAFTMLTAAFGRHQAHMHALAALGIVAVPEATLEAWGSPELALGYLAVLLAVVIAGPGRYSVDAWLQRKR